MNACPEATEDPSVLLAEKTPAQEVLFQDAIALTQENLTLLAHEMEEALQEANWPEASRWAAQLLLVEHGGNVLKHGQAAPGSSFSVKVRRAVEAIELLVRDSGQPWTYEEAPDSTPAEHAEHGRGLMMIRRIASSVASRREGSENLNLFGILRSWQAPT